MAFLVNVSDIKRILFLRSAHCSLFRSCPRCRILLSRGKRTGSTDLEHQSRALAPRTGEVRRALRRSSSITMREPLGDYKVGVHDARLPDSFGGHRVRLFYPAETTRSISRGQARWFPKSLGPGFPDETFVGIMRFLQAPFPWLFASIATPLASSRLNALLDAPMLSPNSQQHSIDGIADRESANARSWPVVLFSHGLGGTIGGYSITCIDIASCGYVVAAIEHSDGSSMNAFVGSDRRNVPYSIYNGPDKDGPEFDYRNRQLEQRVGNFDALHRALQSASSATGEQLEALEGQESSPGPNLRGLIDVSTIHVAGHSFGGATALTYALRNPERVCRVLCLDCWLFPLADHDMKRTLPRLGDECRVLFVDMESADMENSRRKRGKLDSNMLDVVTVPGAVHNNSSDFPIFFPKFVAVRGGMTPPDSNPEELLRAQNVAACAFIDGKWTKLKDEMCRSPGNSLHGLRYPVS